jgi:hypothetical protein
MRAAEEEEEETEILYMQNVILIKKGKSATTRETREARCTKATTTIYPSPTADG